MNIRLFASCAFLASLGTSAFAQQLGSSRASGMGGAGLALPVDISNNYRLNPAFLAFGSKGPSMQWPGLGYKIEGLTLSNLRDLLGDLDKGGLSQQGVLDIARLYANGNKAFAANGDIGFRIAGLAIGAKGQVGVNTAPDPTLAAWAASGGSIATLPATARLDTYGYGYQQIELGYGNAIRGSVGRMAFGFSMRRVTSYYAHKIADSATIASNNTSGVVNGADVAADFVKKDSVGADLGFIYSPPGIDNLYVGAVIENFIEPNIKFNYQAAGTSTVVVDGFDPFKRSFSTGVGLLVGDKMRLAADWVDLGNTAGRSEFRAGAEVVMGSSMAFRMGYNSRTSFTYGLGIGGLNFQLGGKSPLSITTSLKF